MNNLELINGSEIIDFLNQIEGDDETCDMSIVHKSFTFESQGLKRGEYTLNFNAYYNNWGTDQKIYHNSLHITKNKVWFSLNEPFEGDGTDDILLEMLEPWLKIYTFKPNIDDYVNTIIKEVYVDLREEDNISVFFLDGIINKLTKARSYIK